jgi:hypothetical protein
VVAGLADRLKLQVRYETRSEQGYRLVFAHTGRRLGPQVQPSTLECTQFQPPVDVNDIEASAMKRCSWQYVSTSGGLKTVTLDRNAAKRPESGVGYQCVDVRFADGRQVENPVVFNGEQLDVPDTFAGAEVQELKLHRN